MSAATLSWPAPHLILNHANNRAPMLKLDLLSFASKCCKKSAAPENVTQLNSTYQGYLHELKQLISITKNDYKLLYLKPVEAIVNTAQDPKKLDDTFKLIIATLKLRRGYMLPIGTDAETCYQQQDAWTYALFTAALLRDYCKALSDPLCFAQELLAGTGINWLQQYKSVFTAWTNFLSTQDSTDIIAQIIHKAEAMLNEKNNSIANKSSGAAFTVEIKKDNIKTTEPSPIAQPPSADDFITWVKNNIAATTLTINNQDSLLHRVDSGILLVMPDLYQYFLKDSPHQTENDHAAIIAELTSDNQFIETSKPECFIHNFYRGDWKSRDLLSGILIASEKLFAVDSMPAINEQLQPDQI